MVRRGEQVARIATELIDGLLMPKERTQMPTHQRYEIIRGEWEEVDRLMRELQAHLKGAGHVDKLIAIRDRLKEDILFLRGGPLPPHLRPRYKAYWEKMKSLTSGAEPSGEAPEAGGRNTGDDGHGGGHSLTSIIVYFLAYLLPSLTV